MHLFSNRYRSWSLPGFTLLITLAWVMSACVSDMIAPEENRIGPGGGKVSLENGAVTISLPPGAVSEGLWFTAAPTSFVPSSDFLMEGTTFEVGPAGTYFAVPGILSLSYDPVKLPEGVGEEGLALYRAVGTGWELMENTWVDELTRSVSGEVTSLGKVGILGLPVTSVEVAPEDLFLAPGGQAQLRATPKGPADRLLTSRSVSWTSSAEEVATVSGTGLVRAVGEGTATITASSEGASVTASVSVSIPVASVQVSPSVADMSPGLTLQLSATARDASGAPLPGRGVAWESSDTGVAVVDSTGLVTAKAIGSVSITALVEGRFGTATVNVRPSLKIVTSSTSDGVVGKPFSQALAATGGDGSYSWSVSDGTLPNGLALNPSTGIISGTPTTAGDNTFTVQVQSAEETATKELTITVLPVPIASVTVTPSSMVLIPGESRQLSVVARDAAGNILAGRDVSWESRDPGVATVSPAGSVTGVSPGSALITASMEGYSDWSQVIINQELTILNEALAHGVVGRSYADTLMAAGGDGANRWSLIDGYLPPGLSLNPDTGEITGTPLLARDQSFTVQVVSGDGQETTKVISMAVHEPLLILTESLPVAVLGTAYERQLEAGGGAGAYTWAMGEESELPKGLELDEGTGVVSGTPETLGNYTFDVQVGSEDGQVATATLGITVSPVPVASVEITPTTAIITQGETLLLTVTLKAADGEVLTGRSVDWSSSDLGVVRVNAVGLVTADGLGSAIITATVEGLSDWATVAVHAPLQITTTSLADGIVGAAYSQTLAATGGDGTYSWTIVSGSLPTGLGLNGSTGTIGGAPSVPDVRNFRVRVASGDQVVEQDFSITVTGTDSSF